MELSQLTENVSILTEKDPVIAGQYGRVMFTCALHFIWFSHFHWLDHFLSFDHWTIGQFYEVNLDHFYHWLHLSSLTISNVWSHLFSQPFSTVF